MDAILRRRLEMAARVRDFLRAHKTDAVGEGLGLAKLEELLQRAELLGAQQRAGVAVTRAASEQRGKLRRELQSKLLLYLRAVGEVAAVNDTQLVDQFRLPPSNASDQALIEAARGMPSTVCPGSLQTHSAADSRPSCAVSTTLSTTSSTVSTTASPTSSTKSPTADAPDEIALPTSLQKPMAIPPQCTNGILRTPSRPKQDVVRMRLSAA